MTNLEIKKALKNALCTNHSGKMEGMVSLSTSVKLNPDCAERAKIPGSICSKCYADRQLSYQHSTAAKYERNTKLLTSEVYPVECFPEILETIGRFEAFGELFNTIQLENYFNMCLKNPDVDFALWTKNVYILANGRRKGLQKPKNLTILQSSMFINSPVRKTDPWVDKTFTVWDKEHAKSVNINCGGKKCKKCQICYHDNGIDEINEILK